MAKRRLKTILSLAEQNCIEVPKANTDTDFASIILNSDIVFLDKNNLNELSSSNNLVGNETNYISADDRMKSTTEYLTVDENHLIFKASEEIIDFSELHFGDLFNYGATDITINKENEASKVTESLEKVESSSSNFINHDDTSMITYEIDTNKSTEDNNQKIQRLVKSCYMF
ncbi:uncharacterized protein LOC112603388 [Melanaphis sacchari]|uniref:uncharacterized protein LOC112603388 n=1 Tax=Melanaphis sacchari TaxID=742174 RepID=UPI000DC13B92|nr:uncharacterized protein LOC112603388 [Melanaphis sacchari]